MNLFTNHYIIDQVPIYAAHLYDAVRIYAAAVNETLYANEDPRNGTAIFFRIANRHYHSIQGFDVSIFTFSVIT
jgi:guanylate cyclase, other